VNNSALAIGTLRITPPLILAPMAGISDLPFRLLARDQGAPLCFTEMISAQGLIRNGKNTLTLLRSTPEDRPLGIQLFGDDPEALAEAARCVAEQCDLIDINMGCPVKKVVSGGAGSALLRDTAKVARILQKVRKAVTIPLTIKIRSGWTAGESSFLEIARIADAEGCDAITLHPRTRAQMFTDHADWEKIAQLKSVSTIPVIGSGDLFTGTDVRDMFLQTGCNGVMVARGALGNPWIFREAAALLRGERPIPPSSSERMTTALRHLELLLELYGAQIAVCEMRKHISWYVKGLAGAARFRATANALDELSPLRAAITGFFTKVANEQH
jgi:tRNA-dihydrouridine synthase B